MFNNLKRTRASSEKFGNCEVCNKFVEDVYYDRSTGNFGHKECLIKTKETVWK